MAENIETPREDEAEVEAHSASVLDMQGTGSVAGDAVADGNCISLLSVVESAK
ncbi:hypothetical protein GCM10010406_44380 [Streptomyces thermolineatus]|uniref:Uncharacterized protein n=1 Tax=Streptomyces thermolineatus TaxID=44033 RepID=A0ABP5ZRI9_9ACTN